MIYYCIFDNGFTSKISGFDYSDAAFQADELANFEDGQSILVDAKTAERIAGYILESKRQK